MIIVQDNHETITLQVHETYPVCEVLNFLTSQGYEIKHYLQKFPAEKSFLIDEPATERWTFTATKEDEEQSDKAIFTRVFEREFREILKGLVKF